MAKFAILLGGEVTPTVRLAQQLMGSRVIAADRGIVHAGPLHLVPELWVGDFDSAGAALQEQFASVPRMRFPEAKDATDGEIAVEEALRRGAKSLFLVGGFGGQFDHALAHTLQMFRLQNNGIEAVLSSGHEEAHILTRELSVQGLSRGTRLSVLPMSDLAGLSISNVRWPLTEANISVGSTRTLSNETNGDPALTLKSGRALVVVYPQ